jgi:hypothetical protein
MSSEVFVVDLRSVKVLRVCCEKCGFALELPAGTLNSLEYPFPAACPGCKMPVSHSKKFQKDLRAFFSTLLDKKNLKGFEVFLESEKGYSTKR